MKEKKYKDYWEADVGCSYIPFSMLHTEIDLDELEEGGVIDDETVPQPLKGRFDCLHLFRGPETNRDS